MSPPAGWPVARLPVTKLNIGYYAHHHGAGHVTRALADRYAVGGTSAAEHRELEARAAVMRDIVGQQRLRPKP